MQEVLISGYYGFDNAGDEAILESMVQELRREASRDGTALGITVLSANPDQTHQRTGAKAIKRSHPGQIVKALRNCDLFISGGGGLLQDQTGAGLSVAYYLGLLYLAQIFGKPTLLYSQGIGPIKRTVNRLIAARVLNKTSLIAVRDIRSKEELVSLGVLKPVDVTIDPAFSLKPPESVTAQAGKVLSSLSSASSLIGLSVREWAGSSDYILEIAAALDRLTEELGAEVVVLPMSPVDLAVSEAVSKAMARKPYVVRQALATRDILSIVSRLDLLIGLRLHSLIFAAICGVPLVGIVYDQKVASLLSGLELPSGMTTQNLDCEELYRQSLEVWHHREETAKRLADKAVFFREVNDHWTRKVWQFFFEEKGAV